MLRIQYCVVKCSMLNDGFLGCLEGLRGWGLAGKIALVTHSEVNASLNENRKHFLHRILSGTTKMTDPQSNLEEGSKNPSVNVKKAFGSFLNVTKAHVKGFNEKHQIGQKTSNIAKVVGDRAQVVAKNVGDGAKTMAQTIGDGTKSVAQNIGDGAKSAAQNIGDGAKKVATSIGNGAKGIDEKFNVAAKTKAAASSVATNTKKTVSEMSQSTKNEDDRNEFGTAF